MRKIVLLLLLAKFSFAEAQTTGQVKVTINADLGKDTISRHIYGHFAEHLGRCIYDGFYVGENSKIANTEGVRNDIIEALRKIKIPNLRWPGGCFADTYHWKDGIGLKASRPSMTNIWWGGVTEDNSFGTHDFLNLCERLGAEPYISGNVGSGTVQEFADWIQYVNFPNKSNPMANLRTSNGREQPWTVRFWGLGNEAWGCGGNMKPEYYANLYRQYATYTSMGWSNDRKAVRIASGANSKDYNWTEVLMKEIPHNLMEGVGVHHYSANWGNRGPAVGFSEDHYFTTMKLALDMDNIIRMHANVMDKYDPNKKVAMMVDEWGGWYDPEPNTNPAFLYQQNTVRDALLAGVTLNIFHKYAERVKMANLAQTVNVLQALILTNGDKMILTPTYHIFEMFQVHQDALMLPTNVLTDNYVFAKNSLPAVSVSASSKNGKINISLVNIDAKNAKEVTVSLRGTKASSISARILTSSKIDDHNTFENTEKVKPKEFKEVTLKGDMVSLKLPPYSVVLLEVK
jgi:alpha-L-arabinofuranosidase